MSQLGWKRTSSALERRRSLAVLGGDQRCVRTFLQHWTGSRRLTESGAAHQRFRDASHRHELVLLRDTQSKLLPWPGGALVWLFPERGPSEYELHGLRAVVQAHSPQLTKLQVLICFPEDVQASKVHADLDEVAEVLSWAVPTEAATTLEAVWFGRGHAASLDQWLDDLKRCT